MAILYLFGLLVNVHLERIANYIRVGVLAPTATLPPQLDLKRSYVQDELQSIVDTINTMKNDLGRSMQALEREVSVRQLAEQQATDYSEYLMLIFDSMSDALLVVNQTGQIQQYNQSFLRFLEMPEENLVRYETNLHELVSLQTKGESLHYLDPMFLGGQEVKGLCHFRSGAKRAPLKVGIKAMPMIRPSGHKEVMLVLRDLQAEAALKEANFRLTHDYLTGAKNRHFLESRLQGLLSNKRLDKEEKRIKMSQFCLAVIDLDYFKQINDNFGHAQGDMVLKCFVEIVFKILDPQDILARTGGDEFIILFASGLQESQKKAKSILNTLFVSRLTGLPSSITLSASIGITDIDCQSDSLKPLLERADQACYLSKKAGRGRVSVLTAHMNSMIISGV